jgi:peptidoglycan-N-acetylglucosamine deacetylase
MFSAKNPRAIFSNAHMLSVYQEEFRAIHKWGGLFDIIFHPQFGGRPSRIELIRQLIAFIRTFPDVWFATGTEVAEAWSKAHEQS